VTKLYIFFCVGNHMASNVRCGSEVTWKIKQFEVEEGGTCPGLEKKLGFLENVFRFFKGFLGFKFFWVF